MGLCNSCTYQDYYTEEMQWKSVMRPSMHRYFLESFFERKRRMTYLAMMGWLRWLRTNRMAKRITSVRTVTKTYKIS